MNSSHSKYERPVELAKEFIHRDDKFKSRYTSIYSDMLTYISFSGYIGKVQINELILGFALVDYFEDISRLKAFHDLPHINSIKLVSYLSFWLLRRKPLQVLENNRDLLYVNERFVLAYILEFLSDKSHGSILTRENSGLQSFSDSLFYFFKYRHFDAQDIEMIITAFFAGQVYQSVDKDISDSLPASDYSDISIDI